MYGDKIDLTLILSSPTIHNSVFGFSLVLLWQQCNHAILLFYHTSASLCHHSVPIHYIHQSPEIIHHNAVLNHFYISKIIYGQKPKWSPVWNICYILHQGHTWPQRKMCCHVVAVCVCIGSLLTMTDCCTRQQPALPMCRSVSAASCGVARGMIPGSVSAVRSSVAMTKINNRHAVTGTAAVKRGVNRRQLQHTHTANTHSNSSIFTHWRLCPTTLVTDWRIQLVYSWQCCMVLRSLVYSSMQHSDSMSEQWLLSSVVHHFNDSFQPIKCKTVCLLPNFVLMCSQM